MATMFESETCGRCGGSGKYSFNQMDGDRCYGCHGTGYKLTKRGAAASARYRELITRKVSEMTVGMQILTEIGMGTRKVWQTITAINPDTLNGQGRVTLELSRKGKHTQSYGMFESTEMMCCNGQADLDNAMAEALAYQETLTKTGKPAKRTTKKEA